MQQQKQQYMRHRTKWYIVFFSALSTNKSSAIAEMADRNAAIFYGRRVSNVDLTDVSFLPLLYGRIQFHHGLHMLSSRVSPSVCLSV